MKESCRFTQTFGNGVRIGPIFFQRQIEYIAALAADRRTMLAITSIGGQQCNGREKILAVNATQNAVYLAQGGTAPVPVFA